MKRWEINGRYKKKWTISLCLLMSLCLLIASFETYVQAEVHLNHSAQAAIVMDVNSGRVLYEYRSEEPLRVASITKIMTAIIAIELGDLDDMVTTSKNAYRVEGSSIYLRLGERLRLEDMVYGLLLRSGNDAAVAIAEHIGGSVEGFSFLMNQKAEELGMSNSVFNNPHGLDTHEEHYSSAKDMAILTAYALQNEKFAEIVATKRKTAPLEDKNWDRVWYNKNRMLSLYPYADGVKTGFTQRARRTLVSSATKDDQQLVAVTLNDGNDWNDHIHMFEFGFDNFRQVQLAQKGHELSQTSMQKDSRYRHLNAMKDGSFVYAHDYIYPLQDGEHIRMNLQLDPGAVEALENGDVEKVSNPVGFVRHIFDGQEIGQTPILFKINENEQKKSIFDRFSKVLNRLIGGLYG